MKRYFVNGRLRYFPDDVREEQKRQIRELFDAHYGERVYDEEEGATYIRPSSSQARVLDAVREVVNGSDRGRA